MASNSMTGDGRATIEKRLDLPPTPRVEEEWKTVFEMERCVTWIKDKAFKKVKNINNEVILIFLCNYLILGTGLPPIPG